jgi:hypothetical protein
MNKTRIQVFILAILLMLLGFCSVYRKDKICNEPLPKTDKLSISIVIDSIAPGKNINTGDEVRKSPIAKKDKSFGNVTRNTKKVDKIPSKASSDRVENNLDKPEARPPLWLPTWKDTVPWDYESSEEEPQTVTENVVESNENWVMEKEIDRSLSNEVENYNAETKKYLNIKGADYVVSNIKFMENNNTAEISFENLYPGAWTAIRINILNSGDLPVRIKEISFEPQGDAELLKYINYEGNISIDSKGAGIIDWQHYTSGNIKDIGSNINNILGSEEYKHIKIRPGGSFYLGDRNAVTGSDEPLETGDFLIIKIDENAPNSTQNMKASFTFKINISN